MSGPLPFSLLNSWTPVSCLWENQDHNLDTDAHRQHSGELCSSLRRNGHLAGPVPESSKGHSTFLSRQLLQDGGSMVRPVNSVSMGPLPHLFSCEVSYLITSNGVWHTMMEDKAFSKSTDSSFGRNIVCREGKYITQISIYASKNKPLPSDNGRGPM